MKHKKTNTISRRSLLAAFLALPAIALIARVIRPTRDPELVEVDGWILKRSDVEGDKA